MATIKVKRSAVAGRVPATTDLELGEIAINTYDGVAYVKKNVSGTETVVQLGSANLSQNLQNRYQYTATAAQTTFSAVYLAPYVDVYLNGIRLIAGVDYTATNGTTVVLTTAASLNNTIDIVAYTSYTANANFADLISNHVTTALGYTPENPANKGAVNGYASLNSSGQIPSAQLPSFVDDVIEYANLAGLPATGETGKIYVTQDTNKTYRWSGSAYTEIASSPGSTDSVTEGSSNLYFTNLRARNALSATQNLTYSSSTGVFTGPDLSGYLTSATAATVYAPLASPSFTGSVSVNTGTGYGKFTVQNGAGTGKVVLDNYATVPTTENVMSIYADANNGYIQSYNNGYKNIVIAPFGGNLGVGTTSVGAKVDICYSGGTSGNTTLALKIGADVGDSTRTANTRKFASIGGANYSNSAYNIGMMHCDSDSTTSKIIIGGGSSGVYDATTIRFVTATNTTSLAGLERMVIDGLGNIGIGTSNPSSSSKVQIQVVPGAPTTGAPVDSQFLSIHGATATVGQGPSLAFMNISGAKETGWRISAVTASGNNGDLTFHGYNGGADYPERFRITAAGAFGLSGANYGTTGQVLTSQGSGSAPSWENASGGGGSPGGSNTQVQFNNSGAFGGSANLTFDGTGITTGNVNVTSSTAPTTGIYQRTTASSGLTLQNASASGASETAMQVYYGKGNLAASTNSVSNNNYQFFSFGAGTAPDLTMGTGAALYTFNSHGFLHSDVPFIMKIAAGSRGDNASYTVPEKNGHLFIDMGASSGGNASNHRNGILVEVPRQGLGGADIHGIKVHNRNFGSPTKSFWALLRPDDPNGGGQPYGFYAQIDTSNTPYDNSAPVGLVIDNATVDNYTKANGGAQLAIFLDRRSGSTTRTAIQFSRNSQGNVVGTIQTTNSATSYNTSSDYRLKENIAPLTGALEKVLRLKPCTYTWKVDGSAGEGFIAHELQEVIPQAVTGEKDAEKLQQVEVEHAVAEVTDADGNIISYRKPPVLEEQMKPVYQGVDTSFLVATLTAAIQELKAEFDAYRASHP